MPHTIAGGGHGCSNLHYLRTIADIDRLRGQFVPGARIVIVGGGSAVVTAGPGLVPGPTPGPGPLYVDVGVGFVPFKGVGGDYVDALPTADGRVLVTVMDVAGKGMDAALIASGLHTAVHMSVRLGLSLIDIVQTLNRHLIDTWFASTSVTVAAAILDPRTGKVEAINCGHPTPLVVTADGRTRELKCHEEVPLGLMEIELKVGQDRLQGKLRIARFELGQRLCQVVDREGGRKADAQAPLRRGL